MEEQAPIIVISGGMGSGKGTIIHALVAELGLVWVPTHTTRPMRTDDDVISNRVFDSEINFLRHLHRGEMLAPTQICGHWYGLLKHDLEQELRLGHPVVLEVTADGGVELAKKYPGCLLFFIFADPKIMLARTNHRRMKTAERRGRIKLARQEAALARKHYDYLIENTEGSPHHAIEAIQDIILKRFPIFNRQPLLF